MVLVKKIGLVELAFHCVIAREIEDGGTGVGGWVGTWDVTSAQPGFFFERRRV